MPGRFRSAASRRQALHLGRPPGLVGAARQVHLAERRSALAGEPAVPAGPRVVKRERQLCLGGVQFAAGDEALARVRAHRHQQPQVPRRDHQAGVDQRIDNARKIAVAGHHLGRRREIEAAREYAQPPEHDLRSRLEQPHAPVEQHQQFLGAGLSMVVWRGVDRVVQSAEAVKQRRGRGQRAVRRGKLQRERQSV